MKNKLLLFIEENNITDVLKYVTVIPLVVTYTKSRANKSNSFHK